MADAPNPGASTGEHVNPCTMSLMPVLAVDELEPRERVLQESIRKILPRLPHMEFSDNLWRSLGLPGPDAYFSAILSLLHLPPRSSSELALCRYLLDIPDFYMYLANPDNISR